jgi:hypothetical protein
VAWWIIPFMSKYRLSASVRSVPRKQIKKKKSKYTPWPEFSLSRKKSIYISRNKRIGKHGIATRQQDGCRGTVLDVLNINISGIVSNCIV